jgi:hypothetical protein
MSTKPTQSPDRDSIAEHLRIFEELDFEAYSKQNWNKFSESHTDDILVTYPDGHQTKGLKDHVDELKPQFIFAPDTKIVAHPIKFGTASERNLGELRLFRGFRKSTAQGAGWL